MSFKSISQLFIRIMESIKSNQNESTHFWNTGFNTGYLNLELRQEHSEKDSILKSFKNGEIIKNFIERDRLFVSERPRESDFPSD